MLGANSDSTEKAAPLGTALVAGQMLGRYQLLDQLGCGGMGIVFRAYDTTLDRDVALKVLRSSKFDDPIARTRFRKEALTLAKLNHPNIITIHDFHTQDLIDFLIMEYVQGETLAAKLSGVALPEKEVLYIGDQIAAALQEAHERDIIHCDLKPCNVLLTRSGRVKVADFGLSKCLRRLANESTTQSALWTDRGAGTIPYMAPEQLRGEPPDACSDVWAAGCVLYEMSTGGRPFRQILMPTLTDAIFHENPIPLRSWNGSTSAELEVVTLKCLQKDPRDRYQSAKELRLDLQRVAHHRSGVLCFGHDLSSRPSCERGEPNRPLSLFE
jgi:eukaryotic-like serine/threonine-protein kinase